MTPTPRALRVDGEATPNNVDPTRAPRFSWRAPIESRGAGQTAYELVVGRDPDSVARGEGDLWASGWVESGDSTAIAYEGPPLAADETYHWSVRIRDGDPSAWAEPASFTTALRPSDWRGEWIAHQPEGGDANGWRGDWRPDDFQGEEWVAVDLGARVEIESVTLHPADPVTVVRAPDGKALTEDHRGDPMAGFGFPGAYRVELAVDPDFTDAAVVAENPDATDEGRPRKAAPETHEVGAEGRYLRVVATELHAVGQDVTEDERKRVRTARWRCFALAGLTAESPEGEELATGAPVTASSAVESEAWRPENLVNGHPESRMASTSPLLRTTFEADGEVESARLHVAGVGYSEAYVNGERVSEGRLDPAWTDYERRVLYGSYDVGDALAAGENALGLWLGRGWFSKSGSHWRADGSPRARATLVVTYADGSTRTVATDETWRAAPSPVTANDIYDGERYDARAEREGWSEPGFDAGSWDAVSPVGAPGGELRPQRVQSMDVVETFSPETVHERPDGAVLDFGQNLTGWLELDVDVPAGAEITLEHAEALTDDGDLSTTDLRSAEATDTFVSDGTPATYEPRFTYHGFRYARVRAPEGAVDFRDVTAKAVHTAMDRRGEFACSNEALNQVQHNAVWGLRGNTHSIPEDCPQRDERFGWTGDAQISTRSLLFNFDAARFDRKWVRDHEDAATPMGYVPDVIPDKDGVALSDPTWSITRVMVPWYLYRHEGDTGILRDQYEGMRAYVDYWHSVTENGILPAEYGKYGDWLAFENTAEEDERRGLPFALFNTAFHYQVLDTFVRIARVLGHDDDAARYRERAAEVREAFDERFYDDGTYGPGTQSALAVPLFVGLVPDSEVEAVVETLAAKVESDGGKLRTGFLGTRPLLAVLANHGHAELAYNIVSQPEKPGWVYMARQGATTMWERWDSDDSVGSGMNSLNHSPFTHVSEFFYEALAGIRVGERPLTEHVTLAPSLVADLEWAEASVETPNGDLAVAWERTGEGYELDATVPWNATATVRLPDAADAAVTESGEDLAAALPGVASVGVDGDELVVEVGAGDYAFRVA